MEFYFQGTRFCVLFCGLDTLLDGLYSGSCNLLLNKPGPTYGHDNIDLPATYDRQGKH